MITFFQALLALSFLATASAAWAADFPAPKDGEWIAQEFKFHTGEALAEVKLHYTIVGEPNGIPVMILHRTSQSAASVLTPAFGGELFGAGQPLDATKYYIIIPDALGHGKSSKPSNGLKTKFPQYNYVDMVNAQYRLLAEGMGIKHVRLIIGYSMGECMPGFGVRNTPSIWTHWSRWPRNLRQWAAVTGCCDG